MKKNLKDKGVMMAREFCLDCGGFLAPNVDECTICGFDHGSDRNWDLPIYEKVNYGSSDTFVPKEE